MAGFRSNGSSRPISTDDFNARAAALSERLGPVAKPADNRRAGRPQRWQDRPLKPVTAEPEAAAETDTADEPEAAGETETEASGE